VQQKYNVTQFLLWQIVVAREYEILRNMGGRGGGGGLVIIVEIFIRKKSYEKHRSKFASRVLGVSIQLRISIHGNICCESTVL
jgi:hypothetical protein